jgi:serine/threonine-protein kinase
MPNSEAMHPETRDAATGAASGSACAEPASQPTIPGYHIDHLIGEGGFGQVWGAHRDDGSRVAIKVLHLELVRSRDALVRFDRELAAIEQLDHRNVVRALGHGTLGDGRPYLALEFVEGPSLRDVIADRGSLSPVDTVAILEPICDALEVAHSRGLVHRDLKASNVILSFDEQGPRPVLLDFGLVKLLAETGPALTSSRTMLGTPAAMAPEQMRGHAVDARTDVYSLGLLAFHMLTGSPAYGAAPGVVQTYLQLHGPRPRPSSKVEIDPALDEPIVQALSLDPAQRPASARAFLAALRASTEASASAETNVVAVYVEAAPTDLARCKNIVTEAGMTVALDAPDSLLAVAPSVAVAALRERLSVVTDARMAMGRSRATMAGGVVDGPVLDVESWVRFPLSNGLWVTDGL